MSKAWMPFYGGDFLGNTLHLSGAEIGAYVLLLWHCWEHDGCVPADDALLARIARVHKPHWRRVKKVLQPLFDLTKTPGSWSNKRVVLELTKNAEISNKRKGAAEQMLKQKRANAAQSQSQSQSPMKKIDKAKKLYLSMPADFQPDRDYAKSKGWTDERIEAEAQRFRDHASMNGRTCKNWQAAWRNWVTSPFQKQEAGNGQGRSRPLQDDRKSASRAAGRLAEAAKRGEFTFGPRPSLLPEPSESSVRVLPKR